MKKAARKRPGAMRPERWSALQDSFVRGFVSTGLLATTSGAANRRRIIRAALQGGTALASASLAVDAIKRKSLAGVLSAVAAGAAGMYLIEQVARANTAPVDE